MKIILDERELISIPLVERKIIVDDSDLIVEFSLVDNYDFEICFLKQFSDHQSAVDSAIKFISNIKDKMNIEYISMSFSEKIKKSTITLLTSILDKSLELPDDGVGFIYKGDLNYIKEIINRLLIQ